MKTPLPFVSSLLPLLRVAFALLVFVHAGHAAGLVAVWNDAYAGENLVPAGLGHAKAIAGGFSYSLALRTDGRVVGWGDNYLGRATVPAGLTNVVAISAGHHHNLAARADGSVVTWGYSYSGELNVPAGLGNVIAVAAGFSHSLALRANGTVVAWGSNGAGQTNVPAGLANVVAIAAGWDHNLALTADGSVTAWGYNEFSQASVPVGLSNVIAIAAGEKHSVALKADGTVVAWGAIWGDANVPVWVPAGLSNVIAIAAGAAHSVALKRDGTILAWGSNSNGQTNVPSVLTNVTAIAAGAYHNLALVFDGPPQMLQEPPSQEVAWSTNVTLAALTAGSEPLHHQWLFNGTALANSTRIQGANTATLTLTNIQFGDTGTYQLLVSNAFGATLSAGATLTVIGPPIITQPPLSRTVSAGSNVTFTVTAEGTAPLSYQWWFGGAALDGATGSALTRMNVQPMQSGGYTITVSNAYGQAQHTAQLTVTNSAPYFIRQPTNQVAPLGGRATFVAEARGSLPLSYQWRVNGADIPGATNSVLVLSPLTAAHTGVYNAVARNPFGETASSKVTLNVVQAYVWGDYSYSPYFVPTNVPSGLFDLVAVAAGNYHVLALRSDGRVATWSRYNTVATNVPATVTNVAAVAAGGDCSMALRSNGTVVVWGNNSSGQWNVPPNLTNAVAIATGGYHCLALRSNGTVTAWGQNTHGQANVPAGLSNVTAIAAGTYHSLALKADGTLVAWGSGSYGQTNTPAGLSNLIAVAAADYTSTALRSDGTVTNWGSSRYSDLVPNNGWTNLVSVATASYGVVGLRPEGTVLTSAGAKTLNNPAGLSNVVAIAAGGAQNSFYVALVGNGAPAMTIQPASQTASKGATIRLHGRAVGVPPLRYQWLHDGTPVPGATNASLTLTNLQGKDTGRYQLLVSNLLGSIASRTATLTIPHTGTLAQALNTTNLVWTTSGSNAAWFPQIRESHDGDAAAQSGPITNSQQSVLQTLVNGPGTVTFWWKVSSEVGYDFLRFSIINAAILGGTPTVLASISGEQGWEARSHSFQIPSGPTTLLWTYAKDASLSSGSDAGWVDQVTFVSALPTMDRQPFDQTVSSGADVTIPAIASSPTPMTFQWLKNGTNLPGATAQHLTLTNVGRRDSAVYALRVVNPAGSVQSSNATLTVHVPLRPVASPGLVNGAFTLRCGDAGSGVLLPDDLPGFEAQGSTNLIDWTPLPGTLSLTNGVLVLRDPAATNHPARFYRVREK